MDSPAPPSPKASPQEILREQRRAASADLYASIMKRKDSPDIILPDTPEDLSSDHMPLLERSIVSSTPYHKYLKPSKTGEDPFQTPSQTDSTGERSLTTPSTAPQSASSLEIFLGPQPLPYIRNRHRIVFDEIDPSPCRSKSSESSTSSFNMVQKGSIVMTSHPSQESRPEVSNWRKEQLKKVKSIRPVAGARERQIPLLHGPLSLPYARNPSGVDATVADQNSYLSNVFGLRMANSPDAKVAPRMRVASDSTTSRNVSGSSFVSDRTTSSTSSFGSKRPTVVRDFNQAIGIRKPHEETVSSNPYSEMDSRVASLRALGLGKPLPPITGSPAVPQITVQDDAIHSTSSNIWGRNESKTDFKTLTLVDPTTNQLYNVRVPVTTDSGSPVPLELVSSAKLSSKADASFNWRSKGSAYAPPPPTNTPMRQPVRSDILTVDHLYEKYGNTRGDLMKEAIETMAHSLVKKTDAKSTHAAGEAMLSESTGRKVNVQLPVPDKNSKKKNSTGKARKSEPTGSPRAKGTPGAGKHLRRPIEPSSDVPPSPTKVTPRKPRKASSPSRKPIKA